MLDSSISQQLRDVFADLTQPITLILSTSSHEKADWLLWGHCRHISADSIEIIPRMTDIPQLHIAVNGIKNGIQFTESQVVTNSPPSSWPFA